MNDIEAMKLLIKCRELGITDDQIARLIEMDKTPPQVEIREMVQPFDLDEMTEEEVLYYATPFYEELQEKKKKQKERIEE